MNYKRLVTIAFAAACALCRADAPAVNDVWTEGGLNYRVSQKADESLYLTLTGWVSATNEVVVPATVTKDDETLPVLEIGKAAFQSKTTITNLVLSEGLEYIGTNAFYGCNKLLGVNLPDSVAVVDREAFYNCTAMTNVSFGSGLVTISQTAFYNCKMLGEVVLPDSVANVGNSAFYACDGVTNFVIGSGLTRIESAGLGTYPKNAAMNLTINGGGETVIADGAFGSSKIRSVTLRGVKYIGNENLGSGGAFDRCERLESVDFGEDLVQIGKYSFYGCKSLGPVSLPDSLVRIGEFAFFQCTNMTSIAFGSGVRQIDGSAFYYCSGLTDVELPENVTLHAYAYERPGFMLIMK